MTTKFGMFVEHPYLRGESPPPATTKGHGSIPMDEKEKGLNMKATTGRTGKGNDATFNKFQSLYEGDKYVDPAKIAKALADRGSPKEGAPAPFKTVSPMKKSVGPGDYFGTFGGKLKNEPGTQDVKKKKGDIPAQPRGMYTNPPKKGTFGYNKMTLSERAGFKGVATEYEYVHDPLDLQREKRVANQAADKAARVAEVPFRPANPPKKGHYGVPNTTISKGKGIAGEWEYCLSPAPEGGSPSKKAPEVPFRPSNAFAAQRIVMPEYIHDPETIKLEAAAASKKAEMQRLAASGPFKPTNGPKTDMTRSIVKMNIR